MYIKLWNNWSIIWHWCTDGSEPGKNISNFEEKIFGQLFDHFSSKISKYGRLRFSNKFLYTQFGIYYNITFPLCTFRYHTELSQNNPHQELKLIYPHPVPYRIFCLRRRPLAWRRLVGWSQWQGMEFLAD